jgi:hypothetical protein
LCFESVNIYQIVFETGRNSIKHSGRRKICCIKLTIFYGLFDTSGLVGLVIDTKVGIYADLVCISAEDSYAQRMKGADMRTARCAQSRRPLAHLVGSFVCKSYRANIMRAYTRINQRRDSICDDACFSASGAGDDKQGTFNVKDSFFLGRG